MAFLKIPGDDTLHLNFGSTDILTTKYMKITNEQEKIHDTLKVCKDCNCKFSEENNKVHHHDHINGQYMSTICNYCNLK
jgi:hypothetical protein